MTVEERAIWAVTGTIERITQAIKDAEEEARDGCFEMIQRIVNTERGVVIKEEREACAKVVEEQLPTVMLKSEIAAAIRSRK